MHDNIGGIDRNSGRRQKVRISQPKSEKVFFGKKLSTTPTITAIVSD